MTPIQTPPIRKMVKSLIHLGMTQAEVGEHIGVGQNMVSYLNSGRKKSLQFARGMRLYALYADKVLGRQLVLAPK